MPNSATRKLLNILDAMALIASVAVGFWLFLNKIHFQRLCGWSPRGRQSGPTSSS